MILKEEREKIADYGRKMLTNGLVRGTGGNISIYNQQKGLVAISPSGKDYEQISAQDATVVDLDGKHVDGKLKPSSELPMHIIFYVSRKDVRSVVSYAFTVRGILFMPA